MIELFKDISEQYHLTPTMKLSIKRVSGYGYLYSSEYKYVLFAILDGVIWTKTHRNFYCATTISGVPSMLWCYSRCIVHDLLSAIRGVRLDPNIYVLSMRKIINCRDIIPIGFRIIPYVEYRQGL